MAQYDYEMKAGATAEPIRMGIVNGKNSAIDITGAKGGTFRLKDKLEGTKITSNGSLTITDATNGHFQHSWLKGETSAYSNKTLLAEVWITLSDNSILKVPQAGYLTIRVGEPIR